MHHSFYFFSSRHHELELIAEALGIQSE